MKYPKNPIVLVFTILVAGFSQTSIAQNETKLDADSNYSGEVLASAPFSNGKGRIEIRRVTEDGVDGVAIVRTGRIGEESVGHVRRPDLSIADQMTLVFGDLTGQKLPRKAYEALLNVEMLQEKSAEEDSVAAADENQPRNQTCSDYSNYDHLFFYDCKWYGNIVKIRSGTPIVCLLTAAIKGNHTMQVSYKSINGNFYNNFHSDVMQGHYVAYHLVTGVFRTRKGHIYNAAVSDYSRYAFNGSFKVFDATPIGYSDCELVTS